MISNNYFFTLPVYRLHKEKYYQDMNMHIENELRPKSELEEVIYKKAYNKDAEFYNIRKFSLIQNYGGCWEFNEIIGYVKLYFYGNQIRGEYWAVKAKKIVKSRKKQFEIKTHKLHVALTIEDDTNNGILCKIEEYISGCENKLRERYVDKQEFIKLAPHIDWAKLYKKIPQIKK